MKGMVSQHDASDVVSGNEEGGGGSGPVAGCAGAFGQDGPGGKFILCAFGTFLRIAEGNAEGLFLQINPLHALRLRFGGALRAGQKVRQNLDIHLFSFPSPASQKKFLGRTKGN
jgi:hypothetical protein